MLTFIKKEYGKVREEKFRRMWNRVQNYDIWKHKALKKFRKVSQSLFVFIFSTQYIRNKIFMQIQYFEIKSWACDNDIYSTFKNSGKNFREFLFILRAELQRYVGSRWVGNHLCIIKILNFKKAAHNKKLYESFSIM